jgi:thiamine-phosphate pyrophosphorylase
VIRCYITDRRSLPAGISLLDVIARAEAHWVQIREKDLSARELFEIVKRAVAFDKKIIVNTRMDVALAAGATGVHLPDGSIDPGRFRKIAPPGFLIGVSCHDVADVVKNAQKGVDYALLSPIFATISKSSNLKPLGLKKLSEAAKAVSIPVLALGGITPGNAQICIEHGAAGVAGISLFQAMLKS